MYLLIFVVNERRKGRICWRSNERIECGCYDFINEIYKISGINCDFDSNMLVKCETFYI